MKQTSEFFIEADRYLFDTRLAKSYAQIDTDQDAWYFGMWACPIHRTVITYAEGDLTKTICDSDDEFIAEMQRISQWSSFKGIDIGWSDTHKQAWEDLGLSSLLH